MTKPARACSRSLATEVDLESIEASIESVDHELKGALQHTKSIESEAQKSTYKIVPQINPQTLISEQLLKDGTEKAYQSQRRSRTLPDPPIK